MPKKKYIVALTVEERETLEQLIKTGKKTTAKKINHARILLKADCNQENGGGSDAAISDALDQSVATIERVRQKMVNWLRVLCKS
ncbi:MAG: hypothetical protein JO235_20270 [Chroococcidiopsidaceae cyanobacterium CP_BM_RX_35]|nr:hypothetical protein [Chroococcidiopsidaceae cyanobacterium CP_BM_RX_35]